MIAMDLADRAVIIAPTRIHAMPTLFHLLNHRLFHLLLLVSSAVLPAAAGSSPVALDVEKFSSLQSALDTLPASGGVVQLPPGDVEITEPLILTRGHTRLQGAGPATRLINKNQDGQPALILRSADYATNASSRLWRIELSGFHLIGNTNSGDGILAQGINEIYVQGLTITGHGGHGLHMDNCYENPRVVQCNFTYNRGSGVHLEGCHDIVVNANQFEENLDGLRCHDGFNLTMNGNNLDDHLRHGVVIENTYGSVLAGNMIEECNGTAVVLDRNCYGITVSANVIAHHLGGGVDLRDAWGCAVSANTFTLVHRHSIRVGPESGRITITGNNFSNSYIGGTNKRPAESETLMGRDDGSGVALEGASHVVLSGNAFSGLSSQAVVAKDGCKNLIVTANVVTDVAREGQPAIDIGDAENSVVKDNVTDSAR